MKSFAEKLKDARANLDISQSELAAMVGVSQRSITSYENENVIPRRNIVRKLALALKVSVEYLMNDEIVDPQAGMDKEAFVNNARNLYGAKGAKEADLLLAQNKALFAGGELDQAAKDAFFEALMVAYVTCKEEAKKTYGRKNKKSANKTGKQQPGM